MLHTFAGGSADNINAEAEASLVELVRGNERFRAHLRGGRLDVEALARDQTPRVAVLACADSRVAPEWLFDSALGQLFVVRVAGNVANTSSIASLEYAVAVLGVRLILVLGHEGCGAVTAAVEETGGEHPHIRHLLSFIQPAIDAPGGRDIESVGIRNLRFNADRLLKRSKIISEAAENEGLEVMTAYFHFRTATVEFDPDSR